MMTIIGVLRGKLRMAGFYTAEIRKAGQRTGFRWHRLDARTGTPAHVEIKGLCMETLMPLI
jgi:nucleoside-triphosphatase THEP1